MWLVRLKLTIVVGRMLLNLKMLSMTQLTRSSGSSSSNTLAKHSSTQEGDAAAADDGAGDGERIMISNSSRRIRRAVQWFSFVWLLLDLNLLRQLLPKL